MRNKYTKELLEPLIKNSLNWAQVCRSLNIKPACGTQTHVKKRSIDFGIDFSHFTGQAWSRGKRLSYKKVIDNYLSGEIKINSHALKNRLINEGIKEKKCENCGLSEWKGKDLPLELDHIDRNHHNNNLTNLQILCPNCHSIKTREDRKNRL